MRADGVRSRRDASASEREEYPEGIWKPEDAVGAERGCRSTRIRRDGERRWRRTRRPLRNEPCGGSRNYSDHHESTEYDTDATNARARTLLRKTEHALWLSEWGIHAHIILGGELPFPFPNLPSSARGRLLASSLRSRQSPTAAAFGRSLRSEIPQLLTGTRLLRVA